MRKALLASFAVLALVLFVLTLAPVGAQQGGATPSGGPGAFVPFAWNSTGITSKLRILVPDGTQSAPSVALTTATNTGFFKSGSSVGVTVGGTLSGNYGVTGATFIGYGILNDTNPVSHGFHINQNGVFAMSTGTGQSPDTGLSRSGTATVCAGNGTAGDCSGAMQAGIFKTGTNCANTASPAVCSSASAGAAVVAAAATSVVVNTSAVTANSDITVTEDQGLGARLSVTCNTQSSLVVGTPHVTARTAATSFTVAVDVAPTTNPICFTYHIMN